MFTDLLLLLEFKLAKGKYFFFNNEPGILRSLTKLVAIQIWSEYWNNNWYLNIHPLPSSACFAFGEFQLWLCISLLFFLSVTYILSGRLDENHPRVRLSSWYLPASLPSFRSGPKWGSPKELLTVARPCCTISHLEGKPIKKMECCSLIAYLPNQQQDKWPTVPTALLCCV